MLERNVSGKPRGRPRKEASATFSDFVLLSDVDIPPVSKRPRVCEVPLEIDSSKSPTKQALRSGNSQPPHVPILVPKNLERDSVPKPKRGQTPSIISPREGHNGSLRQHSGGYEQQGGTVSPSRSEPPSPIEVYPKHAVDELLETVRRMQGRIDGLVEQNTLRNNSVNDTPPKGIQGEKVCHTSHTHTHTHTHTHSLTHSHAHTHTHSFSHTHTHTHTYYTLTHSHTHTLTLTLTQTHTHTHMHTHTHTHSHTLTHAHTASPFCAICWKEPGSRDGKDFLLPTPLTHEL